KDLMFLIGRYGTAADIYFGTDHSAVTNAVKEPAASAEYKVTLRDPNNIYSPVLEDNTTYYWRVDTVLADSSIVTGDVWSFTVGLPPDPGPVTVFYPIDDATINSAYPDNNWGSNESIRVTVNQRYCFFKFDITGFDGGVRNAVFRVKSWDNGFADLIAHPVTGDWQEETLTWNLSQDLVWGDAVDTVGPIDAQSWYEVDVNSIITGNGEFTIGLKTTATGATNRVYTKESSYSPMLILTPYVGDPDINGDGDVDYGDFAVISAYFDKECTPPEWCEGADLNINGWVDPNDVRVLAESWIGI
ncbi:MAG: DNRLRE domain-containing protein, partial [Planctomycetes bacterium]|nr:DNRLRE domain-containing protein [Planctomycetota bacterium]